MNRTTVRRSAAALALGLVAATAPAAVGASSATAAPYCGITWGSLPKSSAVSTLPAVTGVRAGRHACYDRLVIDHKGRATGFDVRYVSQITADGSGNVIPTRGGAKLQIITRGTRYAAPPAMPNVTGYTTFRQVVWAGFFEGQSTVGLGVRARLPFRAFTLYDSATNTSRLVVDVAHQW
ncbi:AMIN-like domain-containing (lipo)protein [Knoellia sp. LjRoot47]|uniref:AMIN-like domain-containing (lipo)protein n=1 Tax=Knoellia sp. LjRoot47 TaxID=3342330 RepID=UPI003ECF6DA4